MKKLLSLILFSVLLIVAVSSCYSKSQAEIKHSEEISKKENEISSILSEKDEILNDYNSLTNIREIDTTYIDFTQISDPDNGTSAYMLGQGRCSDTIYPVNELAYGVVVPSKSYLENVKNVTTVDCPAYVSFDKISQKWLGADVQISEEYLPVVAVSNYAFFECANLTSITLPKTIKQIGANAFYKCIGLTSITLPTSLNRLFRNAFSGCSNLTNLEILSKKLTINNGVFKGLTIDLDFSNLDELNVDGLSFREYAGEKVVFPNTLNFLAETHPYFAKNSEGYSNIEIEYRELSGKTDREYVFNNCANLKVIDFSKVVNCQVIDSCVPNTSNANNSLAVCSKYFIANCSNLEQVIVSPSFIKNCLMRYFEKMEMNSETSKLFFLDNFIDDYSSVKVVVAKEYTINDVANIKCDFADLTNTSIVDLFANGRKLDADMEDGAKQMPFQLYYYEENSHTESDHYDNGTSYLPLYYYTIVDGAYSYSSCSSHIKNVLS